MEEEKKLTFGAAFSEPGADKDHALARFVTALGRRSGLEIAPKACSYESLAAGFLDGSVTLGWLPPVVFVKARASATPILRIRRGDDKSYSAALIVRADAPFKEPKDLRGARAAWVDPWSAAGFIIPRLWLLSHDVDPRTLFRAESFKWSHKAAIQAVMDGAADVAGTYARVDADGALSSGGWSTIKDANVRVLTKLDAVPPDLIACASSLGEATVAAVKAALTNVHEDKALADACNELFQATELLDVSADDYDALQKELEEGEAKKLFAS